VTLTPPAASVSPSGATVAVAISTQPECAWNATSEANWIAGLTPASGQGAGELRVDVGANPDATARQGNVLVNGVRAQIRQDAAPCRFDVSSTEQTFGASGGNARISVTAPASCAWTARADASWVAIASGATGTGSGAVTFAVGSNGGDARTASLVIAGRTVRIAQSGIASVSCSYTVAPLTTSVTAAGGAGTPIAVQTADGCAWTAGSNAAWLSIASGASGTAAGSVGFTALPNTGGARTGTLTIAGQSVTITQAGATTASCTYTVNPTSLSLAATNGAGTVAVTATAGCAWTAAATVPWLSVTSGGSGTGDGGVTIAASDNTGAARSGTVTVANLTVTVNQAAAACSFAVSPTSASIGAAGGTPPRIDVKTSPACSWTASSNVNWIAIVTGASDTGSGSVTYSVLPNIGPARTGTLTVAGQTVTISQGNGCVYVIAPTSQTFEYTGGTGGPVAVTTQSGCAWTAESKEQWITVTSGATGTGTGSVTFTVAASDGKARMGHLTIAGLSFTVTQQKK
jgi:Putative binding domain, N-terminal/Viral BACON domain